jgi:hypothetical protein
VIDDHSGLSPGGHPLAGCKGFRVSRLAVCASFNMRVLAAAVTGDAQEHDGKARNGSFGASWTLGIAVGPPMARAGTGRAVIRRSVDVSSRPSGACSRRRRAYSAGGTATAPSAGWHARAGPVISRPGGETIETPKPIARHRTETEIAHSSTTRCDRILP